MNFSSKVQKFRENYEKGNTLGLLNQIEELKLEAIQLSILSEASDLHFGSLFFKKRIFRRDIMFILFKTNRIRWIWKSVFIGSFFLWWVSAFSSNFWERFKYNSIIFALFVIFQQNSWFSCLLWKSVNIPRINQKQSCCPICYKSWKKSNKWGL